MGKMFLSYVRSPFHLSIFFGWCFRWAGSGTAVIYHAAVCPPRTAPNASGHSPILGANFGPPKIGFGWGGKEMEVSEDRCRVDDAHAEGLEFLYVQ